MNLFGRRRSKPRGAPASKDPAQTIVSLRGTLDTLEKRQAHLDKQIAKQVAEAKAKMAKKDRRGALFCLKKKKMYEAEIEKINGARLTLADIHHDRVEELARELDAETCASDAIMGVTCDVFSPNALGAVLDDAGIARLDCAVVAGGANNQLARAGHGQMLAERGILYAPDYVINAGGIISVTLEYLSRREGRDCDINEVRKRLAQIPGRLEEIWTESDASGVSPDQVADRMAQKLIGR